MPKSTIIFADILLLPLASWAAYGVRTFWSKAVQPPEFYLPLLVFAVPALLAAFFIFKLYHNHRPPLSFSYLVDFLRALVLWGGLLVAFAYFTKTDYSRLVLGLFFIFSNLLLFLSRLAISYRQSGQGSGDRETHQVISEILKISALSSDDLALLEGVRRARAPSEIYLLVKRLLDLILGLAGLIISLPLYPIIIIWIKRDSSGPAIIEQTRVGQNGKEFKLYKFRTMRQDAELYAAAPRQNTDTRVTKAGKFLRKYSLDELPQFWNVILGQMSLVGPRPEMPFIVEKYNNWQKMRLSVKPGITGIWQILGRKDLPLEDNIEYDLYYVFHQSFFLDLAILLRTLPHLLWPRGAY